ncbi:MAG: hypothetical protein ABIJ12_02175, partial [bacterium]
MTIKKNDQNEILNHQTQYDQLASITKAQSSKSFKTMDKMSNLLKISSQDINSGAYRTPLYRFLTDNVPVINSCICTWARLSAAPGKFVFDPDANLSNTEIINNRLNDL